MSAVELMSHGLNAVEALRSEAKGCSRMGAVFIEYSGGTYVVALFL